VAVSFELVSTVGISDITDLEQVRLRTASVANPVPEPGTLAVLGLSLLGLGLVKRRKA
jgi:hypothetical protein